MSWLDTSKSTLQTLHFKHFSERGITVLIKRDDLIDPLISGNKFRKLKYIVSLAQSQHKEGLLTVGGAYSNHLLATAAACNRLSLASVGIVRGEELSSESNENLQKCTELGMKLVFVTRSEYAERNEKERQEIWKQKFPTLLFVPEGGASYHGLIGCQELATELPRDTTDVFVSQGTTTTSCGILLGLPESCTLHVVPALKGFNSKAEMRAVLFSFLPDEALISEYLERVEVHGDFHFGGYGKITPGLTEFIAAIRSEHDLPLDSVYTSKAFYAMLQYLSDESIRDRKVVFIHTGGLFNGR